MTDFTITAEWVNQFRTDAGAWTYDQFRAVGVEIPPRHGWLTRIVGTRISEANRQRFELRLDKKAVKQLSGIPQPQMSAKAIRRAEKRARKREARRLLKAQQAPRPTFQKADRARAVTSYQKESRAFYDSERWKQLRYQAFANCGAQCLCCGATRADGAVLHVDHIRPRYHYPELQWDLSNLQVLCADCNYGKRAWDETDWRTDAMREMMSHMKSIKQG